MDEQKSVIYELYQSLGFLIEEKSEILVEIDKMEGSISLLLEKQSLLRGEIDEIQISGVKEEIFTPKAGNLKKSKLHQLIEEENNYQVELEGLQVELQRKMDRVSNINGLLSSVDFFQENYIFKINKESDTKIEYGIKILETQESERKRIARDLHDSTVQNLTNMMHKTELCTKLIDIDAVRAKLELQVMINTIKSTIRDMRTIIYDLRPMSLDDLGLVATIETYMREIRVNHEIDISLEVINEEIHIIPVVNLTLFRIVQEATSNSIKHGKARKIYLKLEYTDEYVYLTIRDNGVGFNYDEKREVTKDIFSGYGLPMMKERIILLSGDINIESKINMGTTTTVKVPLMKYKEDI